MATPLFDAISMKLSRRLNDPVSWTAGNAGSDGSQFSNLERTRYLNQANIFIQNAFYYTNQDRCRQVLEAQVKTSSALTLSSSGVSIVSTATDYDGKWFAIAVSGSTLIYTYHPRREELTNAVNSNLYNVFTIETGKLFVYQSGAVLNSGTATITYLAKDEVTQHSATDILLQGAFYDLLVDIAVIFALEEMGMIEYAEAYNKKMALMLNLILGK